MNDVAFLQAIARIYQAARASEDGTRCMVAPHPALRERIKSTMRAMTLTAGFPSALALGRRAEDARLQRRRYYSSGRVPAGCPSEHHPRGSRARVGAAARPLRVIVVLVDFSDEPMTQTAAHYQDLFFSLGWYRRKRAGILPRSDQWPDRHPR